MEQQRSTEVESHCLDSLQDFRILTFIVRLASIPDRLLPGRSCPSWQTKNEASNNRHRRGQFKIIQIPKFIISAHSLDDQSRATQKTERRSTAVSTSVLPVESHACRCGGRRSQRRHDGGSCRCLRRILRNNEQLIMFAFGTRRSSCESRQLVSP